VKDKRIGRFSVSRYEVDERPHVVRKVMKDVIVLRAEFMGYSDRIEYHGIHASFAAIGEAEEPPLYLIEVTQNGDGSVGKVKWVRT
jgi:hypothetical protein